MSHKYASSEFCFLQKPWKTTTMIQMEMTFIILDIRQQQAFRKSFFFWKTVQIDLK